MNNLSFPGNQWTAVDDFITELFVPEDPCLAAALETAANAGLPAHHVTPAQGKLLFLLAKLCRAERILELGTLGGYSTIWLARALPSNGRLISLELNPAHAALARENIARAGVADKVEIRTGPALESLRQLGAENAAPFDFVFIDADKPNYPGYLEWAIKLARRGSIIIADNVVRDGDVANPESEAPGTVGVRQFLHALASLENAVSSTVIQTVGTKGHDGFSLSVVQ